MIYLLFAIAVAAVPPSTVSTIECIKAAKAHLTEFSSPVNTHAEAVQLCKGASSDQAFECAKTAKMDGSLGLSKLDSISLCTGASSTAPVECARSALKLLSQDGSSVKSTSDIANLCRGAKDQTPVACAQELTLELAGKSIDSPVQSSADVIDICAPKTIL